MEPSPSKELPLEDLPKEELVKKCRRLLVLAQRAKNAKDECTEELKKTKDNENKLLAEISALQEKAELDNKARVAEDKNSALIDKLEKADRFIKEKNQEVIVLQETLAKLNFKISEFEIRSTEDAVRFNDFKLKFDKLQDEKKGLESQNKELSGKLKTVEEKYALVDKKLVEFQDKYIEEKKQHAKLQNVLEKKLEEKSERSSAESRDSLQTVTENKEVEGLCDKINESATKIESLETISNQYKEKCSMLEQIVEKLEVNKNESISTDLKSLKDRCKSLECEKEHLANTVKEQSLAIQELKSFQGRSEKEDELQNKLLELNKVNIDLEKMLEDANNKAEIAEESCRLLRQTTEERLTEVSLKVAALESEKQALEEESNRRVKAEISLEEECGKKIKEYELSATRAAAEMKTLEDRCKTLVIEKNELVKSLKEQLEKKIVSEDDKHLAKLEELKKVTLGVEERLRITMQEAETNEEHYRSQLRESEEHIVALKTSVEALTAENARLEATEVERKRNDTRVTELEAVIESLNKQLENLRVENQHADSKFAEMELQLQESRQVSDGLEAMVSQRCDEYDAFKDKVEAYDSVVAQLERIQKDVTNAKIAFEALKGSAVVEITTTQELQSVMCENLSQVVGDFVGKLVEGNSELLSEMNMMNQALKERGATISKLEEDAASGRALAADSDGKLKKVTDKLDAAQGDCLKLRTEVEEKVKFIREMEEEIWRLKSQDNPGDALSTSTISKVEESARLVDIEESFEEKYNKLKVLAVKLKKKVIELQNQVEQEKTKLLNERGEFQAKIAQFQNQSKSYQSLQAEYDKLQDHYDSEKKQTSDLRKSLEKAREESVALAKNMEEVKQEREKFKQEKASFDIIKKELTGQIQNLKKLMDKEQNKAKEFAKEREKLEAEIQLRERKLEEEAERHRATLAKVESQKMEQKKHSLLSLEMADYERTVTELSKRLEAKDNQIRELESSLETQRELSKSLQETVIGLESRVVAEQQFTDASKLQTNSLQDTVSELRKELNAKMALIAELERNCEEKRLEAEKLSIEVAELSADKVKVDEKCRIQQESFSRELRAVEDKALQQHDLIERKELELTELKKEFEAYKIRAQSVLRQSQKDLPSSRQQDIEEELKLMRTTSDSFRLKLEEAVRRAQVLQEENQALMEEKARLFQKVQELMGVVADLRGVNAELQTAEQRVREEGDESARILRLQLETLAQVYKKEIEDREALHKKEIDEIRSALDQAERKLHLHVDTGYKEPPGHRRNPSSGKIDTPTAETAGHRRQHSANFVPVKTERETLDVLMLEREACEGSESVDSTSPRLVPLDQLLAPPSNTVDVAALSERLDKSENRIHHLTSLLSDAESDAARLQQLNEVLKEEIRRKERNEAREQHANNLEYLKNIVVKFATLPRGDERLRLVPVLNTILKLSPEEENKLSRVARVGAEQAGWGTYLGGMWSGGQ